MIARQRDEAILRRLRETGTESARALAELLDVGSATIRRDLARLERESALHRVHGGSFPPPHPRPRSSEPGGYRSVCRLRWAPW